MKKLYYYTDYNTMKLILQNATLRFKQSTCSNDCIDSVHIFEILSDIAKEGLRRQTKSMPLKFIYEYYDYVNYESNKIYMVACFTSKEDSRLLWDAYTMNRKDRNSSRYNGACIEFNEVELRKSLKAYENQFEYADLKKVMYGDAIIKSFLNKNLLDFVKEYYDLRDEPDQDQNVVNPVRIKLANSTTELKFKKSIVYPAITLTSKIENAAPLFKHDFWYEEDETRGIMAIKEKNILDSQVKKHEDNYYYFDLPISQNSISKIILGPEMSNEDIKELKAVNGKLDLNLIELKESNGTGVIRSTG